ncbi:hypothetical protein, partial [Labilibaculum sp.]|uniref:hypothetical protein n=1 Tax=Labilibaculum sp. TaxID=2060723 RepID=UPI003563B506
TDTPTHVTKTMLFIDGVKELNLPIKAFSSIEFATNWLRTGISINIIKSTLTKFKKASIEKKQVQKVYRQF